MRTENEILWQGKPVADGTKPLRKKIVKVAKMIGGPSGMLNKIDANAPEYYSLAGSVSDEECDFLLAMGLRKLRSDSYLADKLKWPIEKVREVGEHLGDYLGVIRIEYNKDGSFSYLLPIFAPGLLEIMVVSPNAKEHPEVRRAFNEYTHDRMQSMSSMLPNGYGLMRVIPIRRALPEGEEIDERDDLDYYLNKYDKFSIGACSCRTCRAELGEGCGHLAEDRCLKMGKAADFFIRTGKDREVTREEAKEILEKCEDEGLMHCIPSTEGLKYGNTTAVCDCCGCSCYGLRPAEEFKSNEAIASNYRCEINTDNCVACGRCVENCPVNAIKLSTKLPLIKEIKLNMQRSLTCNTTKAVQFNPDYRFNRKDVYEETGTAPCKTWCPAHIAVQGYIEKASEGKYDEALELIKKENPFPAVCGKICNHACETHCTRSSVDQAIAIDDIKMFIAQRDLDPKTRFVPKKFHNYSDKKIGIIGGGPAGLSCAYYLAQLGYDITVFEKENKLGGMMTFGIPGFRLEKDIVDSEIEVIKELGVKFRLNCEVGKDVTIPELRKEGFSGFFVAIGAQSSRKLNIPGEDDTRVKGGIDFLRRVNLGNGETLSGNVIVVGGGNVAVDVARTALRQGAEKVHMYCLETRDIMPSAKEEIEEAEQEGIIIHNGWGPKEITKDSVLFKKCTSVFDENKRFNPTYDENTVEEAKADFVLLAIGQAFDYGTIFEGSHVELSKRRTVIADKLTRQSTEPDIFVGGDIYNGPNFCIAAIADGKQAAISLHRFVQPGQSLDAGRDHRVYTQVDIDNVNLQGFDKAPRQIPAVGDVNTKSYKDNRGILTEEQIRKEAARCLKCGRAVVDPNLCVGCGQCVLQCKFDAAHLVKKTAIYGEDFSGLMGKAIGHTLKRGVKIAVNALRVEKK